MVLAAVLKYRKLTKNRVHVIKVYKRKSSLRPVIKHNTKPSDSYDSVRRNKPRVITTDICTTFQENGKH
ncbi:hypothetical protein evm_014454 [Chilo suppressalis]|nr:hypothetical protein evm_014454 [Chilo suppressalis]